MLQEKQPEYSRTEEDADQLSAAVWRAAWPRERLQQRAFFTFGQKMLLALDLQVHACMQHFYSDERHFLLCRWLSIDCRLAPVPFRGRCCAKC